MRKYPLFCPIDGLYTTHSVQTEGDIQTIVCLECGYTTQNKMLNKQTKVPLWLYEKWKNNGGSDEWMLKQIQ